MENSDSLEEKNSVIRARKTKFSFWVNEEEKELIEQKFLVSELPTKRVFFLKSILESIIVKLDLSIIKEHTNSISKIGSNINQIAYQANSQKLRKEDIDYLKNQMDIILKMEKELLNTFKKIRG